MLSFVGLRGPRCAFSSFSLPRVPFYFLPSPWLAPVKSDIPLCPSENNQHAAAGCQGSSLPYNRRTRWGNQKLSNTKASSTTTTAAATSSLCVRRRSFGCGGGCTNGPFINVGSLNNVLRLHIWQEKALFSRGKWRHRWIMVGGGPPSSVPAYRPTQFAWWNALIHFHNLLWLYIILEYTVRCSLRAGPKWLVKI